MLLPDETALDMVMRNGRSSAAAMCTGMPGFDQVRPCPRSEKTK